MLNDIEKKNPFSVPENYFQNFNSEIMDKLPEKEVQQKKIVPLWRSITKWTAAAAVVTGIAFIGVNFLDSRKSDDTITANATSTPEDSTNNMESDYYQFLEDEAIRIAYNDDFLDSF